MALVVFFTAYAKATEPEPEKPSTAAPVMVPYLNKSISEVKQNDGYSSADSGLAEETGQDRTEVGQDFNASYDAVLTTAGAVDTGRVEETEDTVSELVEPESDEPIGGAEDPVLTYLGDWTVTAYCACQICCGEWSTGCTASGVLATSNHTVACGILPFGTEIMIDGITYTVEDTGVEGEWIDIYFDTHEEALAYGMQIKEVYLWN